MKFLYPLLFLHLAAAPLMGADVVMMPTDNGQSLAVHNRILAKVNDKTISVIDVMKQMDVYLSRAYPHLANSSAARHQFFSSNWRFTLEQMIDSELIMLDVGDKDFKITDGEVRETIQTRFGPNVMAGLDKLGLSFEEAKKMIHTELVVQKMTMMKVYSKVLLQVKPQDLKNAYRDYCVKNPPSEEWKYQVVSIRSKDKKMSEAYAFKAYDLLRDQPSTIATLVDHLKQLPPALEATPVLTVANTEEKGETVVEMPQITVSEEYQLETPSLSAAHKEVLSQMLPGTFSAPVAQVSRTDNSVVYRIFYLKDYLKKIVPPFEDVSNQIEEELIDKCYNEQMKVYAAKLREKYGYDARRFLEMIPSDFQPFTLN